MQDKIVIVQFLLSIIIELSRDDRYLRKITIGSEGNMILLSFVFSPMRVVRFLYLFAAPMRVSTPFFSSFIPPSNFHFHVLPLPLPHRSILEGFESRAVRHHGRLGNHGRPASCHFRRLSVSLSVSVMCPVERKSSGTLLAHTFSISKTRNHLFHIRNPRLFHTHPMRVAKMMNVWQLPPYIFFLSYLNASNFNRIWRSAVFFVPNYDFPQILFNWK